MQRDVWFLSWQWNHKTCGGTGSPRGRPRQTDLGPRYRVLATSKKELRMGMGIIWGSSQEDAQAAEKSRRPLGPSHALPRPPQTIHVRRKVSASPPLTAGFTYYSLRRPWTGLTSSLFSFWRFTSHRHRHRHRHSHRRLPTHARLAPTTAIPSSLVPDRLSRLDRDYCVVQRLDQGQEQRSRGNATDRSRPIERIERGQIFSAPRRFPFRCVGQPIAPLFRQNSTGAHSPLRIWLGRRHHSAWHPEHRRIHPRVKPSTSSPIHPSLPQRPPPPFFSSRRGTPEHTPKHHPSPSPLHHATVTTGNAPAIPSSTPPPPPRLPPTTPTAIHWRLNPIYNYLHQFSSRATMAAQ